MATKRKKQHKGKWRVAVFHDGDWDYARDGRHSELGFDTEGDARSWVEHYPRSGATYSRTIREGNWQLIEKHEA